MNRNIIAVIAAPLLFIVLVNSLKESEAGSEIPLTADITLCSSQNKVVLPFLNFDVSPLLSIPDHPRLVNPLFKSDFPKVIANENRVPAGTLKGKKLKVNLEVVWADFHIETPERTGVHLVVLGEKGKAPSVPAPLLRVKTGTMIEAVIENTLKDSTITVYGLQKRPSTIADSLFLRPGEKKTVLFEAGEPGTYNYWAKLGNGNYAGGEEDQLAGAFIIDPAEGSPPDRILVVNVFSTPVDKKISPTGWIEALTINGKSFPFTEPLKYKSGDTVAWRFVNGSKRPHPMHLHGFYYTILSKGGMLHDKPYSRGQEKFVVTEDVKPGQTMRMKWIASRPGKWLFHCHLSWHILSEVRLPGTKELDPPNFHDHMAGLALGFEILPGKTDIIYKGKTKEITMYANDYSSGGENRKGFSLTDDSNPEKKNTSPGPLLVLNQYQLTFVTIKNKMSDPTSIHWHGLEIESWSDGVPNFSSSEGRMSPEIKPGESFTYKLALLRPGTFIYHSHLSDAYQITSGLYGPMIIMPEGEKFNPEKDHIYIVGHRNTDPKSIQEMECNGSYEQPDQHAKVGELHRLRLIDINPVDWTWLYVEKDGAPVPVKFIAKDGADLPVQQQIMVNKGEKIGVGQTADFEFLPSSPGVYTLHVNSSWWEKGWEQKWIVD